MAAEPPASRRASVATEGSAPRRVHGRLAPEAMFPAGLPGYRTTFEQLPSGERVRVVETGPATGAPVVFIPGWACCAWDFNRTLAPVADAGFRAIAIDPRGHGRSDMPEDDALYTTDAFVQHLIDVLDVLRLPRVCIVGHSMGGALAVHLALRAPNRVSGIVPISAVGFGAALPADIGRVLSPRWVTPLARVAFTRSVLAAGLHLVYASPVHVDARNVDEYWAPSQFRGFVPAMRALLHGFRWAPFTREELAKVDVACLLVRGGRDRVVRAPRAPLALLRRCRELMIPEAGHLPHDEAPERVNPAIISFLQSLPSIAG